MSFAGSTAFREAARRKRREIQETVTDAAARNVLYGVVASETLRERDRLRREIRKECQRCTLIRRIVGCHIANGWSNRRPPAIARLSASYGGAFELTGSEQFKRRAIALMVKHGIDARLRDAEQEALRRAKAAAAAKQSLRRPGKP
ncbi:LPD7 domain-containing protein [Burkholderia pseudomallei]|uniref:LPD7 domain-containing protein n=1 Tax=Burkholderia pseudomallei TaxID=28450 RepID=UPI001E38C0CD|nr:LPD7 domain-containing protein [Burkholderia pseudomallei]